MMPNRPQESTSTRREKRSPAQKELKPTEKGNLTNQERERKVSHSNQGKERRANHSSLEKEKRVKITSITKSNNRPPVSRTIPTLMMASKLRKRRSVKVVAEEGEVPVEAVVHHLSELPILKTRREVNNVEEHLEFRTRISPKPLLQLSSKLLNLSLLLPLKKMLSLPLLQLKISRDGVKVSSDQPTYLFHNITCHHFNSNPFYLY